MKKENLAAHIPPFLRLIVFSSYISHATGYSNNNIVFPICMEGKYI